MLGNKYAEKDTSVAASEQLLGKMVDAYSIEHLLNSEVNRVCGIVECTLPPAFDSMVTAADHIYAHGLGIAL
jgi:hypothetical protein